MNLYKIALSLLVTAAPAAARLSSDKKDSSAMMRELMAKVDSMQSEVASLKADNKSLKNEVASLKKNRGLMADLDGIELPDLDGIELPDVDVKELSDLLDVDVDPSSGGGPLKEILFGIINQLVGLKRCVGFDPDFDVMNLSGERRLSDEPTGGYPSGGACFFGGSDIDFVQIEAVNEVDIEAVNFIDIDASEDIDIDAEDIDIDANDEVDIEATNLLDIDAGQYELDVGSNADTIALAGEVTDKSADESD